MDDHIRFFYQDNGFGPAEHIQPVSIATIERYRKIVPNQMIEYWRQYGFCSYGRGLFWTVDPAIYDPLIALWLEGTPLLSKDAYVVIGRSAFGQLFLWGAKTGQSVKIYPLDGMIFPSDNSIRISAGKGDSLASSFFSARQKKDLDQKDANGKPLFAAALSRLGQIEPDEMYGLEPALALGGEADLQNLRKVKIIPHLTLLAQLDGRKLMRDIVKDAQATGLMK